jgi:hypothetical protein
MFETEFCVTRKLYCPTSYEIADVYKLLTQKSLSKIQISRITGIKEEKVSKILEVLKKEVTLKRRESSIKQFNFYF